MMRYGRTRTPA